MLKDHDLQNIDELQDAAAETLRAFSDCIQMRSNDQMTLKAVSILESVILSCVARNVEADSFMETINSFVKSLKHNAYIIESELASGQLEI